MRRPPKPEETVLKPVVLRKTEIKTPPVGLAARVEIGKLLKRLQRGELLSLPQSRPMPGIQPHVHELRVNDAEQTWRVIYRIDEDAIVVVEIFSKKTQQTPDEVIRRSQNRLRTYDQDKQKEPERG